MKKIRTILRATLFLIATSAVVAEAAPFAYVANLADGVSVIDTATNTALPSPVPVGSGPQGVAITPSGAFAYVANFSSNDVSVIDTGTTPPTVVATVPVGSSPMGVAITPDGGFAYVTNLTSNSVSVIATATTPPTVV